ncbi:MAG: cation-translocating P-type ATPase [Patescibacteria group bacterium]|nr:cation-translocating P-type ATPase [Patescibacteria group bacterium]MDE2438329.1 cation-translocating P-type ATPase [Patescibacteria group bacterium]
MSLFRTPFRDYAILVGVCLVFVAEMVFGYGRIVMGVVVVIGSLPTFLDAFAAIPTRRITIDMFNAFALGVAFVVGAYNSGAFIVLMLTSARLLDYYIATRSEDAVAALLALKPLTAVREEGKGLVEVHVNKLREGDVVVIKEGARIPVDGVIVFGAATVNEASVTGESLPIEKVVGDEVTSSTLNEAGLIKVRATRVGKESTLERMAELLQSAAQHKSHGERLADTFASIFFPLVLVMGIATYAVTHDPLKVAALFLVACADDISVAIPLAMVASLGYAAKRGVMIKGGEWIERLAHTKTLVLDKTGTLTYGTFTVATVDRASSIAEQLFWNYVGMAEKFSDHPIGRAIAHEAIAHTRTLQDPDDIQVSQGGGVWARLGSHEVVIGNEAICRERSIAIPPAVWGGLASAREQYGNTVVLVFVDATYAGMIIVADVPRKGVKQSLETLAHMGVESLMLTGDNEGVASRVAEALGITRVKSSLSPEDKIKEIESLVAERSGVVVMVGDGINDAPALARADVGIAMGRAGTAITVEAADVVLLSDRLSRIPEMIQLGKRTSAVIRNNIWIWAIANIFGFALVFVGVFGPTFAAAYNFITDFFPLIGSALLFRNKRY